jgi:hypothetical protein
LPWTKREPRRLILVAPAIVISTDPCGGEQSRRLLGTRQHRHIFYQQVIAKLAEAAAGVPVEYGVSKSDDARNPIEVMPSPGTPKKYGDPIQHLTF